MKNLNSKVLSEVAEQLMLSHSLEGITQIVAQAARDLAGADGATFVLRENDLCHYADEAAISPLWKGGKFPMSACISGWSMYNREVVLIRDIYEDSRIPHEAYRPTFVKSLCMVPIRVENPLGAIGTYWAKEHTPSEDDVKLLQILAYNAAIALENLKLRDGVTKKMGEISQLVDRQKEFETAIHTLAHDLRNPLATILLLTEFLQLKLKPHLDSRSFSHFQSIITTTRQANEQIQRMLALYNITNRKLQKEHVPMTIIAYDLSQHLMAQVPEREIHFDIEPDMNIMADPFLMRLALDNLLSNAVKYTKKKPFAKIEFRLHKKERDHTTFMVRDNGVGFEPQDAEKLFRPLVRLHKDSDFPGTGLGLASVARIIEMHHGVIKAKGEKENGATFFFTLPNESSA